MKYVGLDLHLKSTYGTIMEKDGTVLKQGKFQTREDEIKDFLAGIDEAKIALESSGFCMPWVEFLESMGFEVFVAHPAKVKIIAEARIKTDKIDSKALAHLLRLDYLPCSYMPPKEIRDLRKVARHRVKLGRLRKDLKNRIRGELNKRRIELSANPFTKAGKEKLRSICIPEIEDYLDVMESIGTRIKRAEREIVIRAGSIKNVKLLTSIPGIGPYTGLLISSEIGEVSRFLDAEKLCSYAGIVPSVEQSGSRTKYGSITKQGSSLLRWALIQAVWIHIKHDTFLTRYFHRIVRRKGGGKRARKRAAIATARKMLHVIYAILRDGKPFVHDYLGRAG